MKKFSKILLLVLSLIAIISAFTIIAMADGETAALQPVKRASQNFESFAKDQTYSNSTAKDGKWVIGEADDGNKYVLAMPEDVAGTNTQENIDPSTGRGGTTEHIELYPTMAFDFDIKSTSGGFSSVSLRSDLYGGYSPNHRISQGNSIYLSYLSASLNKVDEWQHVTVIFRHEGDGVFVVYFYVDGVASNYTYTIDYSAKDFTKNGLSSNNKDLGILAWKDLFDEEGNYKYNNIGIGVVSLYACADGRNIGYDNFQFTFYPESYDNDAVATYIYNDDYKMPFGIAEAKVNDTAYDDVNEAVAALNDGDRLTLKADLDGVTIINKAVTVDVNKYDDNGNATGEYYKATIKSNGGYIVTYDAGIYTLTKSEKNVEVRFDAPCGDENCTCYEGGLGHIFDFTAIVPVGVIPEYTGEFKTFAGYTVELLGWSYEKGGEPTDLTAVTEEQADAGVLNLYPVYEVTKYDFAYIDPNGVETYYFAKSFETIAQAALKTNGSKVILYSDFEFYNQLILYSNVVSTIDLNGHTLTKIYVDGSVKTLDSASGEYVETATNTGKNAFYSSGATTNRVQGYDLTFNLISSKPGAQIRGLKASGNVYYDANGDFVNRELTAVTGGASLMRGNLLYRTTINVSNIDIYMVNVIYNDYGSTSLTFNLTNCNFYRTGGGTLTDEGYGYDCFYFGGNVTATIKDSLFYFPSSSIFAKNVRLLRCLENYTRTITFENCDIISDNGSVQSLLFGTKDSLIYKNCRVYGINNEAASYKPTFEGRVIASDVISSKVGLAEDHVLIDYARSITYSLPTVHRVTLDANGNPVFNFAFADRAIAFTKLCDLESNIFTSVTWLDANGMVADVTKEFKNETAAAPAVKVPSGDGLRAFTNPYWLDESGNKSSLLLGDLDSYTFKASTELPEDPRYVGYITDVLFNISFTANFRYNIYLPTYDKNLTVNSVSVFEKGGVVKVDGYEYSVYSFVAGTATAADDTELVVNFTVDGADYTQTLKVNALLYAELMLVLSDVDEEKLAVGNMARFIMEARKVVGADVDEERFNAIISDAGVKDYAEKYEGDGNIELLADYLYSVSYVIYNGNASYKFVLNDASYIDLLKFNLGGKEIGYSVVGTQGDKTYIILDSARVYDVIGTLTITAGDISATYSMLDNIEVNPTSALLKSLYEFGIAAENYRAYLQNTIG